MQPQKIYVNEREEATIVCSSCGKRKKVNAQQYLASFKPVNVKCSCGFVFPVTFEKRKHYRKSVRIPGAYALLLPDREQKGNMTVKDLSRTGIAFELNEDMPMRAGQLVRVRFVLDDADKTEITKLVEVRNVDGRRIGASFPEGECPKALAFYLMP
ncbi:MAG: PilZ domain-containing protein [Deltaproteobacteria bacterium]|nr:PilZ domain-containing protein [Deltaproteobacteria bacterium]